MALGFASPLIDSNVDIVSVDRISAFAVSGKDPDCMYVMSDIIISYYVTASMYQVVPGGIVLSLCVVDLLKAANKILKVSLAST